MRSIHALSVALLLVLQVACSGGDGPDPQAGSPTTPTTGDSTVGLTVQWPAAFAGAGDVHTSAITLPNQVISLDMTIQVLGADFPGRVTEVHVERVDGVDVTTINGVVDDSGLAGITISVPVGDPRRVFISGSAELNGPRTVSFSGFVDLTVTADPDQRATVTLFEGRGGGQVPTFETVDPTTPTGLHVGDATDLVVSAAFDDGFQVDQPGATYRSSDTGVATVDDQGHVTIVGPGTAIITITVGEVAVDVTITVENTAPVLEAVADQSDDDGTVVSLALSASDADGDTLMFAATGLPTGLSIDAATGEISGTIDPAAARSNAVTVTASDGQDDASQGFTWEVIDVTDPVVTAPGDLSTEATAPLTPVPIGTGTANDLVDGALVPTPDDPGPYAVGVHVVTWSATDTAGNVGTATQTVTVTDTTAPVVTAPLDVTVEATAALTPVALGAGTANDLVDGALVPTPDDPGPYAVGVHLVTWSATDGAGNTGVATQTVTVTDTTAPVVTAPLDVTVEATAALTPVALGAGTANDLVDGAVVPTPDDPGPYAVGPHVVTWSATDGAGNTGTASQTVTVVDTTAPAVTAPADVTMEATAALTPVALGAGTADDLVDGVLVPAPDDPGPYAVGATVVTWSATDGAGNTGTATQTVTVTDTVGPAVRLIFPLGGVVGDTTTVTITAQDTVSGVSAVTVTGTDVLATPVDLVQDATDPTLWRGTGVDVVALGAPLSVAATDGAGNTTPVSVPVRTGAVPASVGAGDAFVGPVDVAPEVSGSLVVVDKGDPFAFPAPILPVGVLRITPETGDRALIAASDPTDVPNAIQVAIDNTIWVADGDLSGGRHGLLQANEGTTSLDLIYGPADPDDTTGIDPTAVPPGPWTFIMPNDFAFEFDGSLVVLDATECSAFVFVEPIAAMPGDLLWIDGVDTGSCQAHSMTWDGGITYYLAAFDTSIYRLDPAGVDPAVAAGFTQPIDLAAELDGQILVIDYDGFSAATLLRVDPASGASTPLAGTGPALLVPQAVAVDSRTGRIFVVAGVFDGSFNCLAGIWQVDPVTGDRALLSASPASDFAGYCGGSGF